VVRLQTNEATRPPLRMGFRHCDPRYPFLWTSAAQPPARWHGEGEGPANYFCDTPEGAWAEFLRHEEITQAADLAGVRRSLWAVALPAEGYVQPAALPATAFTEGEASYEACRAEARRLRAAGGTRIEAPSAALLPGAAAGWRVRGADLERSPTPREGRVWVIFGAVPLVGWIAAEAAAPPAAVLPWVRPLAPPPAAAPQTGS
jgi:hypothetical protein